MGVELAKYTEPDEDVKESSFWELLRRNRIGGGGRRGLVCCESNKSRSRSSKNRSKNNKNSLKTSRGSSNSSQKPPELKRKISAPEQLEVVKSMVKFSTWMQETLWS